MGSNEEKKCWSFILKMDVQRYAPCKDNQKRKYLINNKEKNNMFSMVMIAGALAGALLIVLTIVRNMLFIGRPNEILVVSGKSSQLEDGSKVGYSKVMGGGRAFRIPVLHQIESMSLTSIPIDI